MGGASGSEAALISAILGSSLLGGITAPQGQKLTPFRDNGIDPSSMMVEDKGLLEGILGSAIDEANSPVELKTTVNPLPSYKGGGLPMAISAPGQDANRLNPDLRTTQPPVQIPKRRLPGVYDPTDPNSGVGPPVPTTGPGGYGQPGPAPSAGGPGSNVPPDPELPNQPMQEQIQGGDPLAAVKLLSIAHGMTF